MLGTCWSEGKNVKHHNINKTNYEIVRLRKNKQYATAIGK